MKSVYIISAFLGGAIVGAGAAILFAPMRGEDLRKKVKKLLKKNGVKISDEEVDSLVAELAGLES